VLSETAQAFVQQIQQAGCDATSLTALAFSADRKTLYVAESDSTDQGGPNQIGILDTATNQFIGSIPISRTYNDMTGLTLSSDGSTLYVDMSGFPGYLGFVDRASATLTGTVKMPETDHFSGPFALDPKNGLLYNVGIRTLPSNEAQAVLDVVDPKTRGVVNSFVLTSAESFARGGGAVLDNAGNLYTVWSGNVLAAPELLIVDPATGNQIGSIAPQDTVFGFEAGALVVDTKNDHLFIDDGRFLDVYDLSNNRALITSFRLGDGGGFGGMAFNASQSTLYISEGQYIYGVDTATNAVTSKFLVAPAYPQKEQDVLAAQ
jgi:hypothetical protein